MLFSDGMTTKVKDHKALFWFTLACTALFGLIAHGYSYFNIMYSHDSLVIYQGEKEMALQLSVGRFMAPVYIWLRGMFYTPSLIAVLSLLFLGIAIYLMLRLCKVEKKLFVICITGILTTSTTITLLHTTYMHDVDRYMLSLLLAVLGVYLLRRYRWGMIGGAFMICASLGLYQSYFQAAILLVMILAVLDILEGKHEKAVLAAGVKGLVMLLAGLLLYYIGARVIPVLLGVGLMDNYNGLNNVGGYGSIGDMLVLVIGAYRYVFDYFLHPVTAHSTLAAVLNVIIGAALLSMLCYIAMKKRIRTVNGILLVLLVLLMPFGMNVIYFISHGFEHHLMIFSFFMLHLFFFVVFEQFLACVPCKETCPLRRKAFYVPHCVVACVFAWLILNNVIYANQMYLQKELEYQNTLLTINRVIDRIEQTDGYMVGETPVALVGTLQRSELSMTHEWFDKTNVGNSQNFAVTYYETYENYFERLLAYPIALLEETESAKWAEHPTVQNMPSFPYQGSCEMVEGTLIVKLSE